MSAKGSGTSAINPNPVTSGTVTINNGGSLQASSVFQYSGDLADIGGVTMDVPNMKNITDLEDQLNLHKEKLESRMDAVEDQVLLIRRDRILEQDFEELEEAWQAYNDLMEKLRTFKRLRDSA